MSKIRMNVILGEPGSGKSFDLVNRALDLAKSDESLYVFTPTRVSKKRLLSGYFDRFKKDDITRDVLNDAYRNTNVLQYNYLGQKNILIDEFSMLSCDDFFSLLYRCLNSIHEEINMYCYADQKQLEPVNATSALMLLLKSNLTHFKGLARENFWSYVQNMFYDDLDDGFLDVPESWKLAVESVYLNIKHENYRLDNENGILAYNDSFYHDVLDNQTTTKDDYTDDLLDRYKKGYLIVAPTHAIGEKVDNILSKGLIETTEDKIYNTKELSKIAPFVRAKNNKIYINPYCTSPIAESFEDFVPVVDKHTDIKKANFTFYATAHSVQGCTVDNVVFYLGNYEIPNDNVKSFFTRNLLYVALSRAKFNSEYFGKPSEFLKMLNIYPDAGGTALMSDLNSQALKQTYGMVVDGTPTLGKFSNEDILKLYQENFDKILKENKRKIDELSIISSFQIRPLSDTKVLSWLNPDTEKGNQFTEQLIQLGYGFQYHEYIQKQKAEGNSKGGKVSKVKDWVDSLDDDELEQVKSDLDDLSQRKFQRKYHKTKSQVVKYIETTAK